MGIRSDVKTYARFALGLRGFLRQRITPAQAGELVRQRLRGREEAFLRVLRKGIFGYARSPYLPLLASAGCEFGDIGAMVRSAGLEQTLRRLHRAGVYVTFDEFKGRKPIVRNGVELPVLASDFDNPHLSRSYWGRTSGSTGPGTRVALDLDHILAEAPVRLLVLEAHGLVAVPSAVWRAVLPTTAGIYAVLWGAVTGELPQEWFSPTGGARWGRRAKDGWALDAIVLASRLASVPFPRPKLVTLDDPGPVLEWIVRTLDARGACVLSTFVSPAVRVCEVARDRGIDLSGATFSAGGEPPTPAKVAVVTGTGAGWLPNYSASEVGMIGVACARPTGGDDYHVARDCVALIQVPLHVPGRAASVGAFHVTSLLPSAPKMMLNVALDDFGVLETRSCGCPLEELGYVEHVRSVRSYGKLTGEGVTLIHSDVVRVLEEVLPARFGGSPLDYQLLEEEDERGLTRLSLLISPRVQLADEQSPVSVVLEALKGSGHAASFAAASWQQAGSLRVRRAEPVWGAGGKFMPLTERSEGSNRTG